MATISHSSIALAGTSPSDLLKSSSNGISGVPLKSLGKARFSSSSSNKRELVAVTIAKLKKGKKHEYPWPNDADPNVKGGVLTHLSYFKPQKIKGKPVTLDFEKPLVDLERKIVDVRKMANETGLDFSDQILSLENKYQQIIAGDPESVTETWMSNVYSYGMVIWEMVTGEVAYASFSPVQAAVGIAACGLRPETPKDCP